MVAVACIVPAVAASPADAFSKAIWGQATYNGVDQFPMYKQLGVSIIELDLDWSAVAPTRPANPSNPSDPAYVWPASIQQTITEAASYHMRVLLQLIGSPPWANGGQFGFGWAPLNAASFVNFATAAGKEYPRVDLWMIWGEPTKAGNFMPLAPALPGERLDSAQRASDRLYAEMVNGAYGALKRISKRNLLIGGCTYTTGAIDPRQWIENMRLPDGKPPRMDMYAHNPFSYASPVFTNVPSEFDDVQFANLPELAGWVDRYIKKGLPLFLSEWTIPTQEDETFNFWVDPTVAARWVKEALRECRAWHRIYALGWVNVYDDLPIIAGGLLTANGTPKPDFYAFANG
ncbi:MAG: hypothetical protein ACLP8S_19700 [Solirubrobacteraceae bacterium]